MWRAVGCPKLAGSNPVLTIVETFPGFSKDEVPHTDAPIAPPESEMAGVLAGGEF